MNKAFKAAACFALSLSLVGTTMANSSDEEIYKYDFPVVPEIVTEDTYYDDGVLLRNITTPDDFSAEDGSISASFDGEGAVVIGHRRGGGYPRIVLPAGAEVSVNYKFLSGEKKVFWDGRIVPPLRTFKPKEKHIAFSGGNHFGKIQVESAFQVGIDQEIYTFPSGSALVFFADYPDLTRLWYGLQSLSDEEMEDLEQSNPDDESLVWTIEENNYCVIQNKLCVIPNPPEINKIVFVQETFSECPNVRIENGIYGGPPHCNILCNSGYEIDFESFKCVAAGTAELGAGYEADLSRRTDYNTDYKLRPGYFSYRDSRGSQLEQRETEGLAGKDLDDVQYANVVKSPRRKHNTGETEEDKLDKIWDGLQNLDFQFWRNQNEVRPDPELMMDDPAQTYEEKVENCENCEESETIGAILPRTGPAGFIGIAFLGLLLVSLGLRRR